MRSAEHARLEPIGTEQKSKGPRAAARVLDLLLMLAGERHGLSLAELSVAMGVPKSTLIDTLRGLRDQHFLLHQDGRYSLGPAAFHLACRITTSWSAPEMVRKQVTALAIETGESVGFAIADWEIGQAIYTEAINSVHPVRYAMQAGLRAPLYASAAGRVLLAFGPPHKVDAYLAHARFKPLTGATRTNPTQLREHLAKIREDGYCASFGEMLSDTAAIGVPIRGLDGSTGSIMLAAPLERMKTNYDRFLAAIVRAGAHASASSA
jgi:IclR family acetate operon transcriptional repressor